MYDAFGLPLTTTGTTPNNFLYSGEQFDNTLGLYYLRARYYNPATGRFLTMDPAEGDVDNPVTLHKYVYAGGAVRSYLENLKVGKVVVRDAGVASDDKRTHGQKFKDLFTVDYHAITVDLQHTNPFGNNADSPDFVKAWNMAIKGDRDETFGDLRQSDPTQWSNIIAWRVLHESISHAFGIGPDNDQLILVGGDRAGTLIEGAYDRGHSGIPGLNPGDTSAIQKLLVPRSRSYVP